jgi:hypothetical protein
MTEQPVPPIQYRDDYADQAQRLARLGLSEEGIARVLAVPVYAVYEWVETRPEFAAAVEQGWAQWALQPPRPSSRYKYPAYTYLLRFAARVKDLELAGMLKDEMAAAKATGGPAALDEALRTEVLAIQPLRNIPVRST